MEQIPLQTPGDILSHARSLVEQGRLEEIEKVFIEGLHAFPASTDLLSHLGYYYSKRGRIGKAIKVFQRRNDILEPDATLCELLAELYAQRNDYSNERYWLLQAREQGIMVSRWRLLRSRFKETIQTIRPLFHTVIIRSLVILLRRTQDFMALQFILFLEWMRLPMNAWTSEMAPWRPSSLLKFLRQNDSRYFMDGFAYHKIREVQVASHFLPINKSQALILDIGTGLNPAPLFWSLGGSNVICLDGSTYGFQHLKEVEMIGGQNRYGIHTDFLAGDTTSLPLANQSIDGISALCMVEHIPGDDDIHCMQELFRVLKPGGVAVITVETNRVYMDGWQEVPYAIGFQSGKDMEQQSGVEWREVYCRHYSPDEMKNRLAGSCDWIVEHSGFFDDGLLPVRAWISPHHPILAALLRSMQPLLSLVFYRHTQDEAQLSPSSIGYLILRKPE